MKLGKWLDRVEEYTAGLLFVAGILVSLYGVLMRYVFNLPPAWITEIFEFLMVWAIFIGFGMALKDNRHIVVDLVYDKFPFSLKRIVSSLSNLIGASYSFYLAFTGLKMTALAKTQNIMTIDVGMPIWITYIIMPVGMALLGTYFLIKCFKAMIGDKREILGDIEHEKYIEEEKRENKGGMAV